MKFRFLLILTIGLIILSGCSSKSISQTNLTFDTVATISLYGTENREILKKAFETLDVLDGELDAFSESSIIGSIDSTPKSVSPEIYDLIRKNIDIAENTGDAFNPLLGNLIELWNINEPDVHEAPNKSDIEDLLVHTDLNSLILDDKTLSISITDPQTKLNLGASAKGFAADTLKEQLIESGVKSGIINLGGNILLIGSKDGKDFNVGIDNPDRESGGVIGILKLQDKSIVTSGNYQRYFTDSQGRVYHHILDPSTGYPVENELNEVVVVADSSLEADILSTAFFVLGKEKSLEYLKENYSEENRPEVLFVTDDTIYIDERLENHFELSSDFEEKYKVEKFTIN